jgi:hypothetical protein
MKIEQYPSELAACQTRLRGQDLSLQDIEEIEHEVMVQTTDKTRQFASSLLQRCDEKKKPLIDRQIVMLDQATDPVAKIGLLTPLIPYMEPQEVDEKLEKIEFEASLSSDPKVQKAVTKQLEHLQFAQAKPLVHDLKEFTLRLKSVGDAVLSQNSLDPMVKELNQYQIQQVRHAAARGSA